MKIHKHTYSHTRARTHKQIIKIIKVHTRAITYIEILNTMTQTDTYSHKKVTNKPIKVHHIHT